MTTLQNEPCKLVVLDGKSLSVLLCRSSEKYSVPHLELCPSTRMAEQAVTLAKERWGIQLICLFGSSADDPCERISSVHYQVAEMRHQATTLDQFKWFAKESLAPDLFSDVREYTGLMRVLAQAERFVTKVTAGPLARIGWLDELLVWMNPRLAIQGLHLTGQYKQLSCGPFFTLVRFETNGPAVWFKAVGEPNLREYFITIDLSERYPEYFPKMLGVHHDWNGWLTEEFGTPLRECRYDLENWKAATENLAELQVALAGKAGLLQQLGCSDWRIPKLVEHIDPFIHSMIELMSQQPTASPRVLTEGELYTLAQGLKELCDRVDALDIPESLVLGDFGPHNILCANSECKFIDLAECHVGLPFLTFQYLLDCMHNSFPEADSHQDLLRRIYADRWQHLARPTQVARVLALMPVLTPLWYAISSMQWTACQLGRRPQSAKHLRGLVRTINRRFEERRKAKDR